MDEALSLVMLLIAVVSSVMGLLVLRADHRRWDSKIFAAMVFVDAATECLRVAFILDGAPMTGAYMQRWCGIGGVAIAYLTIEFVYSFPFDQKLPMNRRVVLAAASLAATVLSFHPATRAWFLPLQSLLYFVPVFLVTIYYLFRNYQRIDRTQGSVGIPLLMLAVGLRWTSSILTWAVARNISRPLFEFALYFDATASVIIGYALAGTAFLKYQLFRVRGLLADILIYAGFGLGTVALLYLGVEFALTRATGPMQLRAMLIAIGLIPFTIHGMKAWLLPKIESLLRPIDPRRAVMKSALAKLVHETSAKIDSKALIAASSAAVSDITGGGRVEYLEPGAIDPALAEYLRTSDDVHLHRPHALHLSNSAQAGLQKTPGDLFVPVRRDGNLYGTLAVTGGDYDREAVQTAVAVADHLALKLENFGLFSQMLALTGELEESRRLAALGQFAAAIAHDIRTPLTSVQMNVQILRGKAKLPPDDMEYFDIALEELKRLNLHISELLDYAKPVQMKPSPIDLREVADDAARGMEPILSDRKLHLLKEHEFPLPQVIADAGRIRQVLVNLLDNAAQASSQGGSIMLRTRAIDGQSIALEVSDTGKGIEEKNLPKIFEPFFTTRADGTGLGLAIAQKLVKAHGGEIRVQSTVGEGSTFTIVLPAGPQPRVT